MLRAGSFCWFAFFMFATLQYCTLYGVMAVSVTPNLMLAAVLSSAFYSMWNLFAGFIIPKPVLRRQIWRCDPACSPVCESCCSPHAMHQACPVALCVQHASMTLVYDPNLLCQTKPKAGHNCLSHRTLCWKCISEKWARAGARAAHPGLVELVLLPEPLLVEHLRPGGLAAGPRLHPHREHLWVRPARPRLHTSHHLQEPASRRC